MRSSETVTGSKNAEGAVAPGSGPELESIGADSPKALNTRDDCESLGDQQIADLPRLKCLNGPLPEGLAVACQDLADAFDADVWLMIQRVPGALGTITDDVWKLFFADRESMSKDRDVVLLLDSPGGQAAAAFKIARLFQRHAGRFKIVVPRYAKSAATLLALGAEELLLCDNAELGPLDAQIWDNEIEEFRSALDAFQALERLHASAREAVDQAVMMLLTRSGKRIDTLLPMAISLAAETMKPIYEHVDVLRYTQSARDLKVAEDYATRLLAPRCGGREAELIARHLVYGYSEHGFVIDVDELRRLGVPLGEPTTEQREVLAFTEYVLTADDDVGTLYLGKVTESQDEESDDDQGDCDA